jgi:hypothetical protein
METFAYEGYTEIGGTKNQLSGRTVLLIASSVVVSLFVDYYLIQYYKLSSLTFLNCLSLYVILTFIVVGGYQLFFWAQSFSQKFPVRSIETRLDQYIPFVPQFSWCYSFIYYMLIGLTTISFKSMEEAAVVIFGGIVVLLLGCLIYCFFPVKCPVSYRSFSAKCASTRFLKFIHRYDKGRACMPSMHCAICSYVCAFLFPVIGDLSYVFVALIALSCLLVKQHQVLDIVPGILLGLAVYWMIIPVAYL